MTTIIHPPITGDSQLDSWTYQLTSLINQGLNSAEISAAQSSVETGSTTFYLYQRSSSSSSAPTLPTNVVYNFNNTPIVSSVDNGWSSSIPTSGGDHLWVTVRYVAERSGTIIGSNSWDTPSLLGTTGPAGAAGTPAQKQTQRIIYTNPAVASAPSAPAATITWSTGALSGMSSGWSESPPTQSATSSDSVYSSVIVFNDTSGTATTTTATGATPVKATEFSGLVTFSSGDFVTGGATITNIDGGNITTGSVKADAIDLDGTMTLDDPVSAFVAGRTSTSDFGSDGFYIGRTSTNGTTANGFQLSSTSLISNSFSALIHDNVSGLALYNPTIKLNSSNASTNSTITTSGNTVTLAGGEVYNITILGGGGGGGGGGGVPTSEGTAPSGTAGGTTTVTMTTVPSGYSGTTSWTAAGGAGGAGGTSNQSDSFNQSYGIGTAGQSSQFGDGGTGGGFSGSTALAGGAPASGVHGAGGGGGAGEDDNTGGTQGQGKGGTGGNRGGVTTATINLTGISGNAVLTVSGGAAGSGASGVGSGASGGNGSAGVLSSSDILTGYDEIDLSAFTTGLPKFIFKGANSSSSSNTQTGPSSTAVQAGDSVLVHGYFRSSITINWTGAGTSNSFSVGAYDSGGKYVIYTAPSGTTGFTSTHGQISGQNHGMAVTVIGAR